MKRGSQLYMIGQYVGKRSINLVNKLVRLYNGWLNFKEKLSTKQYLALGTIWKYFGTLPYFSTALIYEIKIP